jgi:exodeoxyribonuclease V alpha subunit
MNIFQTPEKDVRPKLASPPGDDTSEMSQFHGEVMRVTYRNDDNGWSVLKVIDVDTQDPVTVTGNLPPTDSGEHLQLIGTWSNHSTFGRQFKAHRAVPTRPTSHAAILRYLRSGLIKGIGDKTAEKIVDHFGVDTFKVLDENPGCLLQVPRLGKKKAQEIITSWKAQKAVADVMMFLIHHGISPKYAQKIMKLYGDQSIELISANPYQLAVDIHGIGFKKADVIAQSIGIALDSPERIRAGIIFLLQQAEEKGHCFLTDSQVREQLTLILGVQVEGAKNQSDSVASNTKEISLKVINQQLKLLVDSGSIFEEISNLGDSDSRTFWLPDLIHAEINIAAILSKKLTRNVPIDPSRISQWMERYNQIAHAPLSETQTNAVLAAVSSPVFVLTGGPGVGKTTTANAIIRLFKAMGKTVLLAAPTGRAAQRLSEISAEKAKTIHRLLEWQPLEGAFARNSTNPLASDVVLCDESSMLDVRLAQALIESVAEHSQLIFIGDVDQLPSVGPGNVLRDLIQSDKVPSVTLTEIFRQAATSSIIRNSHAINKGIVPEFSADVPTDCQFIEVESTGDVKEVIAKLVQDVLPHKYGWDPKRDIQILTPMNRGDLGTQALNEQLQSLLNSGDKPHLDHQEKPWQHRRGFRKGDKVIQTANNYNLQVFNGDIGFVDSIEVNGGNTIVSFGEDRVVNFDDDAADDLRLAYAITIHKSQGSEFPVVILPMSMAHYVMLQRNLVYTGLTRARKLAIFIGSIRALGQAIRNNNSVERQTKLSDRIRNCVAP